MVKLEVFFFLHIVWMMKPKSGNDRGKVEDGRLMHNRRSADVYRSIGEAKQLPANAREKIQKAGDSQSRFRTYAGWYFTRTHVRRFQAFEESFGPPWISYCFCQSLANTEAPEQQSSHKKGLPPKRKGKMCCC